MPKFRIDHVWGTDIVDTEGTFDFDGGSLLVWKDQARRHLVAAYSPATQWMLIPEQETPKELGGHGAIHIE